ncbi:9837_t:CDS:2 [Racocetra fulgida]|uniref:9837_t:CDS:1 n=1 Tax=Racocetra fulgida TaxID=60492 RepID=A0A9N8WHL6_9GLOM|nr:9837_t:CDS:2 [Racocetra fulgida]
MKESNNDDNDENGDDVDENESGLVYNKYYNENEELTVTQDWD